MSRFHHCSTLPHSCSLPTRKFREGGEGGKGREGGREEEEEEEEERVRLPAMLPRDAMRAGKRPSSFEEV